MLFNPIVPLHFQRDTWQIIDWVTIGVIVVAGVAFWPPGVFSQQFHFKLSSTKNNALYDEVAEELQAKTMVPGLWTKAFAEAGGQMDRARALYIKYRVAQLAQEATEQLRQEQRATRGVPSSKQPRSVSNNEGPRRLQGNEQSWVGEISPTEVWRASVGY